MNILIVDDKRDNLYFLESLLSGSGYKVKTAVNGKEALELLDKTPFDLIISDILMPVMDGFELCRRIKNNERHQNIPLVFYTATYIEKKDEEFAMKLGASKFIRKPQEPEKFLSIINEVLENAQTGKINTNTLQVKDNETIYKLYNERLVNKLEKKIQDLEKERYKRQKIEKEVKMLAHAIRSIREAVCITDLWGKIIFINEAFEKMYGYSKKELQNQNISLIQSVKNQKNIKDLLHPELSSDGWQGELIQTRKNSSEFPVSLSISIVRDTQEKAIAFIIVASDLTERKALEEQYRQAQKMEAIGRLAGGIAHDFNNILTVINGYSELLLHKLNENDPLYNSINEIFKAGIHASVLTRQLLTFSRKQIFHPVVLDVNEIILELDKMLRRLIGENIELSTILSEEKGNVKVDPGQIEQVIMNLVVNARDAMPLGGKLRIETQKVRFTEPYIWEDTKIDAGTYIMLAISDTGNGMDKETLTRIFEPFFTTKKEGKGAGLGLSTVYGIIKQSDGFINVYSEQGKGTTFKIYLPCVDEMPKDISTVSSQTERLKGSETILVTEDDETLRNLICGILTDNGYNVLEASNGGSALLKCEKYQEPIHLILSDVVMPEMSGRELVERLILIHPEMKVVYMSGYTDDAVILHQIIDENVHFLQKPFSPLALLEKIRIVLDSDPTES